MNDSNDLQYSSEAFAARYVYFQGLNDINLFVEDIGKAYEYETIFKRLFGDMYPIIDITPAGGKPKLKERFKEFGTFDSSNPKIQNIYIADGDFDRYAHAEEMIINPNFIYLKAYNIENYYIDKNACIQYVKGKMKCLDREIKERFNFQMWKVTIVEQSTKLFLLYCYLSKYYPSIENVSRPIGLFLDTETGFERKDGAFEKYFNEIKTKTGDLDIENRISEISESYKTINGDNYFNLICGKFLLKSLGMYIRSVSGSRFDNEDFKWHLINHFDISKLNYVKEKILSITRNDKNIINPLNGK